MKVIEEKTEWENRTVMREQGNFLQSFSQKKLYENLGQKTWLFEHGGIRSLVTKVTAKRGTFLFLPYGPILAPDSKTETLQCFFQELETRAKEEKASFIRVAPFWEESKEYRSILSQLSFQPAPIHMLAETLWILDFEGKKEDELLANMEKKHRNLIRRAEKEGLVVEISTGAEAAERFIALHHQTVDRLHFTPYPDQYFRDQVSLFSADNQALVFEVRHGDDVLASAIIMFYGKAAAFHHGASSSKPEHRKLPASYLLQWSAIREALKRGCIRYNFWGIAPTNNPSHPFYGITHFKKGFGGRRMDLLPCHDRILNARYYLNWSVETFRRLRRGFGLRRDESQEKEMKEHLLPTKN